MISGRFALAAIARKRLNNFDLKGFWEISGLLRRARIKDHQGTSGGREQ